MIPAGYPRDLPSALLRAARDFAGSGVVEIGPDGRETRLDYPVLLELAARILAGLRANGVRAGDPAVVHCTEPVGFFAAFWACTLGGIRPLLISPAPEGDRSEEGRERLRRITDLLGWTVLIGRPADLPNDLGLSVLDPDALAGYEPTSDFHRPAADDVALLLLSSGTSTGLAKIVQLTHRGLVEFAAGTPAMLPVRPGQVTLNWQPLDASGAFLLFHLLPVFTGCTNIHANTGWVRADPLHWLDLMDQYRVNHSWSPNFGYQLTAAAIAADPDRHWDLSALRSLVSGGEQITVPVMSDFLRLTNRFGVVPETFVAAWGMTETVTGITFARPGLTPNVHRVRISPAGAVEWVDQRPSSGKVAVARPGKARPADAPGVLDLVSVGAPAPGATIRIVAPNGAVLPEGRVGQVQVASARVTPGYLGNPEADRAAFPAGNWPARKWLATGDQGFLTGGQLVITGRDSERLILAGRTHYAPEIEAVASTAAGAPRGLIGACGVPDPETGTDRLVVFYAITEDAFPGLGEGIRAVIRDRLGLAAEVVGVPQRHFPATPGGKVLRPLLRRRWLDNTLETPENVHLEQHLTAPGTATAPTSDLPQNPAAPTHPADASPAHPPTADPVRPLPLTGPTDPGRPGGPDRSTDPSRPAGLDRSVDAGRPAAVDRPAALDRSDGRSAAPDRPDAVPENAPGDPADLPAPTARTTDLPPEDASERTTELPAVRPTWQRELQNSIPVPPPRPTLGANRTPEAPTHQPNHPSTPEPQPTTPAPTKPHLDQQPAPGPHPDEQPAAGPGSDEQPAGPRPDEQPAAGPDSDEQPAEPRPDQQPAAGPRPDERSAAGPRSDEQPAAGPRSDEEPAAGPRSDEEPAGPRPVEQPAAGSRPEELAAVAPGPQELGASGAPAGEPDAVEPRAQESEAGALRAQEPKGEEPSPVEPSPEQPPAVESRAEELPAVGPRSQEVGASGERPGEADAVEPGGQELDAGELKVGDPSAVGPGSEQLSAVEPGVQELDAGEPTTEEPSAVEPGSEQLVAVGSRAEEQSAVERSLEVGGVEAPAEEVSAAESRADEPSDVEQGADEARAAELAAADGPTTEAGAVEGDAADGPTAELAAAESGPVERPADQQAGVEPPHGLPADAADGTSPDAALSQDLPANSIDSSQNEAADEAAANTADQLADQQPDPAESDAYFNSSAFAPRKPTAQPSPAHPDPTTPTQPQALALEQQPSQPAEPPPLPAENPLADPAIASQPAAADRSTTATQPVTPTKPKEQAPDTQSPEPAAATDQPAEPADPTSDHPQDPATNKPGTTATPAPQQAEPTNTTDAPPADPQTTSVKPAATEQPTQPEREAELPAEQPTPSVDRPGTRTDAVPARFEPTAGQVPTGDQQPASAEQPSGVMRQAGEVAAAQPGTATVAGPEQIESSVGQQVSAGEQRPVTAELPEQSDGVPQAADQLEGPAVDDEQSAASVTGGAEQVRTASGERPVAVEQAQPVPGEQVAPADQAPGALVEQPTGAEQVEAVPAEQTAAGEQVVAEDAQAVQERPAGTVEQSSDEQAVPGQAVPEGVAAGQVVSESAEGAAVAKVADPEEERARVVREARVGSGGRQQGNGAARSVGAHGAPAEVVRAQSAGMPGVEGVAVIGLAARLPGAASLEQFWDNLVGGVESIRRFSREELDEAGAKDAFGADELVAASGALDDVEAFDAAYFGLSSREAELIDPSQRLFLEVCHQALEHGGYAGTGGRVGVFAGSGMNLYTQQNQPTDYLATRVAYRLGLTGPAIGVQAAWSSSLVAVHLACQALRSGDADLALAGAAAVHVPQATAYHADAESILSPSGHVRAFDAAADGTVGGNGVAAVLLKRLDQAVADGDTVYAVIRGSAVSNQTPGTEAHGPEDGGLVGRTLEQALEQGAIPADSLSYLEASATGTPDTDAAEFRALAAVLGADSDRTGFCTIGSVKPNIGHLDSAAGMAGLIKTVLMLQHRTLVPTINLTEPNPALPLEGSPFVLGTELREWSATTPLRAGISAVDASGTSAHVIVEEAPRQVRRGDDGPVVLPLSSPDPDILAELAELYRNDLSLGTGHRLIDLAGTAALGRLAHRHRLAVTGASESELAEALGSAQTTVVPRGGPGPLGFAFTGQGAARRGMAAGLAARFPAFRSVLDECDRVYAEEIGGSLLELLLTPAGTEGVWPTETAQPALFAFELALARLWQSFGVQPALVVGSSVGEYAALCVAGALTTADGVRLTAKRGELMQRGTVPGAMVAVRADADRVRELAQTSGVEIAAGNGPQSFVLSGSEVIVGQLAEQLDQLEVSWQRLDVDRAFHTSLVEPILAEFGEVVREITLKPLRMPMVSSWSGELLESGTVLDTDYLVGQLRQPVLFGDAVEALTAAGCRRFLELGPDAVLSPAGRRIAPNSTWIPAQRLGQDPVLATMNGLAELFEQGTEIDWSKVYPDGGRVPLPTYPFRRVHHPVAVSTRTPLVAAASVQPAVAEQDRSVERAGAALKRIPLDLPPPATTVEPPAPESRSPFDIPAADPEDAVAHKPPVSRTPNGQVSGPAHHQPGAQARVGQAGSKQAAPSDLAAAADPIRQKPADQQGLVLEGAARQTPATGQADRQQPERRAADPEVVAERYRQALEAVFDLTAERLGLDPFELTVDHTFAELGATPGSLESVAVEIGRRFGVELAVDELFGDLTTPHKLATAVASRNLPAGTVDPLDLIRADHGDQPEPRPTQGSERRGHQQSIHPVHPAAARSDQQAAIEGPAAEQVRDPRAALAVLGSGLAELAARVDAAAEATSEADLPGAGMAALMAQQLRVAGQLVDGVTQLMREQLGMLAESPQRAADRGSEHVSTSPGAEQKPTSTTAETPVAGAGEGTAQQDPRSRAESSAAEGRAVEVPVRTVAVRGMAPLEYWQLALDGAQALVLPADRSRPDAGGELATVRRRLPAELATALNTASQQWKVSPSTTLTAVVGTVLGRFAAQEDLTIGVTLPAATGRAEQALPLRIDLSGEPDLGEVVQRVNDVTLGAIDHAGVDLSVLELDPLYRVLVEFGPRPADHELDPLLDLRLQLVHTDAGIDCTAEYRSGLFDETTVIRYLAYLEAVLHRGTADPALVVPDLMLPIEPDLERLRDLEGIQPTTGPVGRTRRDAVVAGELSGLHTLFEQQVARTPDALALVHGDRELTYAELDRRANAVAWQLVDLGVKPGQFVAIRVTRGIELVVAILAVLKSGAAYVPLDPGVPESRWSFMTSDSSAAALVGDDAALADRLGLRLVPVAAVDGDARAKQAPPVRAAADDIAYCVYTSGSSGNPKGVVVPHRGPVNLVRHYLRTRRSLRTLQWTPVGFDVHVEELFTTLASGAALVLLSEDDRYDPDAVIAALLDHGVERLFMGFGPLTALLATMRKLPELPALREIVASGEAMVLTHKVREFMAAHPDCRLFNEYGPEEASVVATIHEVDLAEDRPSIGRPIDGVVVRLLDQALRPVPVGAVGEIHLGGAAVAQGYLGRPEETERVFVADPARPGERPSGGRLYRSRDLGRWRADGTLEYLGRADDQVKIRGHRVEPGETEHVLADQPGVVDAVVVPCTDPAGDTCLIGYVVLDDSDPAVLARLMLDLTKELPIYLVPADLIPVEELPLDANGKLDRNRLPDPDWLTPAE